MKTYSKTINILTPENIEVEYYLADIPSRTAAAIIDMMVQSVVFLILFVALFLFYKYARSFWDKYYGWLIGITILLVGVISYGYFIIMELSQNGQTYGKKLMKLRAIRTNGQSLTIKHSAIRNLVRIFVDMLGVGVVTMFFNKQHKRVGDIAASTIVVYTEKNLRPLNLEVLDKLYENFKMYIDKDEYEILREYYERREGMEDTTQLKNAIAYHFSQKFFANSAKDEFNEFLRYL